MSSEYTIDDLARILRVGTVTVTNWLSKVDPSITRSHLLARARAQSLLSMLGASVDADYFLATEVAEQLGIIAPAVNDIIVLHKQTGGNFPTARTPGGNRLYTTKDIEVLRELLNHQRK